MVTLFPSVSSFATKQSQAQVSWKNRITNSRFYRYRTWQSSLLQLLRPALFVLMIGLSDWAVTQSIERFEAFRDNPHPHPQKITSIPDCHNDIFLNVSILESLFVS